MEKLTTKQLKDMWIKFFTKHGHNQIASASLVPQNDNSVLFTTAGMHPLIPYLLGEPHRQGKRLCDYQKCLRTNDIESVGDMSHLTFFEMLGSWSLGDYFKTQAIEYSYEFLTSKEYLNIPLDRLAVTVFAGNADAPKDEEAYNKWKELGIKEENIFYLSDNWWQASEVGPCGPDSEMFFITDKEPCCEHCNPSCDCGRYLEIWNDVFMGFEHKEDGSLVELKNKNIDTGMGLERTVCVLNGYESVYDTDVLRRAIEEIENLSGKNYNESEETKRAMRIIADHMRASTMLLGDEVPSTPSNVGRGYVLRRLIRRSVNYARGLGIDAFNLCKLSELYIEIFKEYYPSLIQNKEFVLAELNKEIKKFSNTIGQGLKEFEKVVRNLEGTTISGESAFRLYETFGFPIEITQEMASNRGLAIDMVAFKECAEKHKQLSKQSLNGQVFKSGLSGTGEMETKYHTATHLLLATLQKKLSPDIIQRGSNNTAERLRFDFNFPRKLTPEEIKEIEDAVNEQIKNALPVVKQELTIEEARKTGAMGIFNDKYGDVVTVYSIGDYSKEFCAGPHVKNTSELGTFKIKKEESSSSGVRRIKAILE